MSRAGWSDPRHGRTIGSVLFLVAENPGEMLLRRWNWKAACMSALSRGLLFLATNISAGLGAAAGAMAAEAVYRSMTAGFYGALTQAFRHVRPVWAASLSTMILLPLVSHSLEFAVHWLRGTQRLGASIAASACFTVVTTLFNLYAMRRGVLIVGEGGNSLRHDLRQLPLTILSFARSPFVLLCRITRFFQASRLSARRPGLGRKLVCTEGE